MAFIDSIYNEDFTIGFRKRINGGSIIEEEKSCFKTLPRRLRYWYADPFIFVHNEVNYVFCEVFDKLKNRGYIGYFTIKNNQISRVKIVIKNKYHMSYPFIYSDNNNIFIIPETLSNNNVVLYKAIDFPDKWILHKEIFNNNSFVDVTVYKNWIFCSKIINNSIPHCTHLYIYNNKSKSGMFSKLELISNYPVCTDISAARMAGRIFEYKDEIYRPSQDCSDGEYGKGLVFNRIEHISENEYRESVYKRKYKGNIYIKGMNIHGIHSYSINNEYEVVDVKIKSFSPKKFLKHILFSINSVLKKFKSKTDINDFDI